jgi:pyridoxamine 5'-phosphate oxidase
MSQLDLSRVRTEYGRRSLSESEVDADPIRQLTVWIDDAVAAKAKEPNAMTLATCDGGRPSARVVLLKKIGAEGLLFCTNYQSRKGTELAANPRAAAVFWWPEMERQVRVEGTIRFSSPEESAEQFSHRPAEARIAAAASPQSRTIASRAELDRKFTDMIQRYPDGNVPCPPHWGGYWLRPELVEFWQGGRNRLHDRIEYAWNDHAGWVIRRLAP